jgi:hypothetical protein
MPIPMSSQMVLDRYFLELRCKVLDVAAGLDRIAQAPGFERTSGDERLSKLKEAISILLDTSTDRAEHIQMIFSDPYHPEWPRPSAK